MSEKESRIIKALFCLRDAWEFIDDGYHNSLISDIIGIRNTLFYELGEDALRGYISIEGGNKYGRIC